MYRNHSNSHERYKKLQKISSTTHSNQCHRLRDYLKKSSVRLLKKINVLIVPEYFNEKKNLINDFLGANEPLERKNDVFTKMKIK